MYFPPGYVERLSMSKKLNARTSSVRFRLLLGMVASLGASSTLSAQSPGKVDPTFNPFLGLRGKSNVVAAHSGGKILVAGSFAKSIARLNSDGTIDTSFDTGLGGLSSSSPASISAIAVGADGKKIFVAGRFTHFDGSPRPGLVVLDATGRVDPTFAPAFGLDGVAGQLPVVRSMVPLPDGGVLIAGYFGGINGVPKGRLARLTANGSVDPNFNPGGTGATTAPEEGTAYADLNSVRLQPDGKILIVGHFTSYNGVPRPSVARLLPNGQLDTTFTPEAYRGSYTVVSWGSDPNVPDISDVVVQPDGKIVFGGDVTYAGSNSCTDCSKKTVIRVNSDGSLDGTFGKALSISAGSIALESGIAAIALDAGGKLLIGGSLQGYGPSGQTSESAVRLNSDGTFDGAFQARGVAGISSLVTLAGQVVAVSDRAAIRLASDGSRDAGFVADPAIGLDGEVTGFITQPSGKIVLMGNFGAINSFTRRGLARVLADGTLDLSFNPGDGAGVFGSLPDRRVNTICAGLDGAMFVNVGFTEPDPPFAPRHLSRIARVLSDGTIDPSFAGGTDGPGTATIFGRVGSIAVYTNGKIVVGGSDIGIRRYNQNGTVDASFNYSAFTPGTGVAVQRYNASEKVVALARVEGRSVIRLLDSGAMDTSFAVVTADSDPTSLRVAPDGKLYLGGNFSTFNGQTRYRVVRLHPDGTVDTSFSVGTTLNSLGTISLGDVNADGTITVIGYSSPQTHIRRLRTNGTIDPAFNVDVLTTGNIYVVGSSSGGTTLVGGNFSVVNGVARSFAARLLSDGTIDKSFVVGLGSPKIRSIIAEPRGAAATAEKIIVGGDFTTAAGVPANALARLRTDGSLDPTFKPPFQPGDAVQALARRSDGAILAAALEVSNTAAVPPDDASNGAMPRTSRSAKERPDAGSKVKNPIRNCVSLDGSFDPSFNNGNPDGVGTNGITHALALQSLGEKILVAGEFTELNEEGGFLNIGRLNADGTLDGSFRPTANLPVRAVAVHPTNSKTVLGGDFTQVNGVAANRIVRLRVDGSIDPDFVPGAGANGPVTALVLQSDDRTVLGGNFTTVQGSTRAGLARLQSNGTLDPAFQPGAITRTAGTPVIASIIQESESGKLIVGGLFDAIGSVARHNVARLNTDGSVDPTFDPGAGPDDIVHALALQADRKPLLGGAFTKVDVFARNAAARLFGGNEVAAPYRSSGSVPIPDQNSAGADSSINVSGVGGRLLNVRVQLHLKHLRVSDLTLRLIAPDGTAIDLAQRRGGSGDNFGSNCPADANDTVFDDGASVAISAGSAPFAGTFRPDAALSVFNGKTGAAVNGAWKLRAIDAAAGEVGFIECWSLQLTSTPAITAFSPPSGLPGTRVTLRGSSLTDVTAVRFNDAVAQFAVTSDTEIVATVPPSATTGFITVSTPLGAGGSLAAFTVQSDSDGDGMSDEFEQLYFGSPSSADPAADTDRDGASNLSEYRAGTDPTNAQDVLRISVIRRQGNDIVIVFPAVAHKTYRLEAAASVGKPFDTSVVTILPYDSNTVLEVTEPGAAAHASRLYRVVVVP